MSEKTQKDPNTERLQEAVSLLDKQIPSQVRIAAHMLDDIIKEDPKNEHRRIVDSVTTWLEEKYPLPKGDEEEKEEEEDKKTRQENIYTLIEIVVCVERKESGVWDEIYGKPHKHWPYLAHINLSGIRFPRKAFLQKANLQYANLQHANLQHAKLQYANLQDADLFSAKLQHAELRETDLQYANLQHAELQDAKLQKAKLQVAVLQHAHLEGAMLPYAKLQKAYLQHAHLEGAMLPYANLEGAELQKAHLQGANLETANLHKANLEGADIETANLEGANISEADLSNAQNLTQQQIGRTIWQEGRAPTLDTHLEPSEYSYISLLNSSSNIMMLVFTKRHMVWLRHISNWFFYGSFIYKGNQVYYFERNILFVVKDGYGEVVVDSKKQKIKPTQILKTKEQFDEFIKEKKQKASDFFWNFDDYPKESTVRPEGDL